MVSSVSPIQAGLGNREDHLQVKYKIEIETDTIANVEVYSFGVKLAEAVMIQHPGVSVKLKITGDDIEDLEMSSDVSEEEWDL